MDNKNLFISIFTNYVRREGRDELLEMLNRTDFYAAPASAKYHCSFAGGLVFHSLNVYRSMIEQVQLRLSLSNLEGFYTLEKAKQGDIIQQNDLDKLNITMKSLLGFNLESLVIASLCHSFCKIHFYENCTKRIRNKNGEWEDANYYSYNPDPFVLGEQGTNSWYIADSYMRLTYEEKLAIENHMSHSYNGYPLAGSAGAYKKSKLALFLHLCDMIATFEVED